MRMALVIENFDPRGGGAERNLVEVAHGLTRRGHDVTILCANPQTQTDPKLADVEVRSSPQGSTKGAGKLRAYAQWAEAQLDDFDTSLSVTMSVPAAVLQPLGGTIRENHARNIAIRTHPLTRAVKRLAYRVDPKHINLLTLEQRCINSPRVKAIAALSQYVVDMFTQGYGLDPAHIRIIPNAVDLPLPSADEWAQWRSETRAAQQTGEDQIVYLFSAFNPKLKGSRPLLRAMRQIVDQGIPAQLWMTGKQKTVERNLITKLGLQNQVLCLGPTQSMARMYAAADVTVHPTYYDPSSRVVIESLIAGRPAITTRFNGAADFIRRDDGRTCGRVIDDPGNVPALADAMLQLADEPTRLACADATQGLAEHLCMSRHVEQLEALLKEVAE